ncbi:MAG: LemA family protein [Bacteroidota bacterium]|nr:LemA family protein [Bacteroidota bacterium]
MNKTLLIAGGVVLVIIIWFISAQNGLVEQRESIRKQLGQVDNVYQRRFDLIPNLVATVKGYASHEKELLENVTRLRSQVGSIRVTPEMLEDPAAIQQYDQLNSQLNSTLGRLLAVAESYPELKANENFKMLQVQIEGSENRIATERRRYNEYVGEYNTSIQLFPKSIVASIGGFKAENYFKASSGAEQAPKVEF